MDTSQSDRRQESEKVIPPSIQEQLKQIRTQFVGDDPHEEIDKARKHNTQITQSILESLNKGIDSRWTLRKEKEYLKLLRWIVVSQNQTGEFLLYLAEANHHLKEALFDILTDLEFTRGLNQKDMETIKSKMDGIFENPAVKTLTNILQDSEEALKKLDKNRKQVLGDSVV